MHSEVCSAYTQNNLLCWWPVAASEVLFTGFMDTIPGHRLSHDWRPASRGGAGVVTGVGVCCGGGALWCSAGTRRRRKPVEDVYDGGWAGAKWLRPFSRCVSGPQRADNRRLTDFCLLSGLVGICLLRLYPPGLRNELSSSIQTSGHARGRVVVKVVSESCLTLLGTATSPSNSSSASILCHAVCLCARARAFMCL